MFYLIMFKTKHVSTKYSLSGSSEGLLQRGEGGARVYRSLATETRWLEQQKITVNQRKPGFSK